MCKIGMLNRELKRLCKKIAKRRSFLLFLNRKFNEWDLPVSVPMVQPAISVTQHAVSLDTKVNPDSNQARLCTPKIVVMCLVAVFSDAPNLKSNENSGTLD